MSNIEVYQKGISPFCKSLEMVSSEDLMPIVEKIRTVLPSNIEDAKKYILNGTEDLTEKDIMDAEIVVAVNIVGEEAHAALQGHGVCAQRQNFLFLFRQTGAGFQETLGKQPEQLQIHTDQV